MNSGYYAACAGLQSQARALELIAGNVANLNTTGYRGQQPSFRSLLLTSETGSGDPLNSAINDFNVLESGRTDLSAGSLERTGNQLDLGIEGAGFFAIQTKAGVRYTRNGNFQVSPNGQLTTSSGDLVLGEQGAITLPSGTISISADGTISTSGAVAGRLKVVEFAANTELEAVGDSYYSAPDGLTRPATGSSIRQGMLESSNVNSVSAVVDLITVQRRAEMLERAMSVFHSNFNHIAASDLPRV
jgi:flagellar basal-body rod protein FlgF/flagellar basal-body rod protein FlgG